MKIHFFVASCCLVLWTATPASRLLAQDQQVQNQVEESATTSIPAPLGGTTPLLVKSAEQSRNQIVGSLGFSALYDDNAASTNSKRYGDYQYSISPSVGLLLFQPHTQWNLNYSGGVTFDQRALGKDLVAHDLNADVQHFFTQRLMLELRQDYLVSSNPFDRVGQSQTLPSLAGPGQLNPFAVTPTATRIAYVTSGNMSYQLSQHSSFGFSGNFSVQHFRDVAASSAGSQSLIDSRTTAGRAFYAYQISRNQKIGAEYQLQNLTFGGNQSHTLDHTLFLFDEISITQAMSLSLYVGPEYSHSHTALPLNGTAPPIVIPTYSNQLSPAAGVTYTWRGKHTGFRFSGQRNVSDGGGLLGAVRLNSVSLGFQRSFTRRWSASLGASYSDGLSLNHIATGASNRITTLEGDLGIQRQITRNISMEARYARVQQPHAGVVVQNNQGNHNRIELGVVYRFRRPFTQ